MNDALEKLRNKRTVNPILERGKLPEVEFTHSILADYIIFTLLILFLGYSLLSKTLSLLLGNQELLISFLSLVGTIGALLLFWFWPFFFILNLKRKVGAFPKDDILKHFNKRYQWLTPYLYQYKLIEPTTPAEEKCAFAQERSPTNFKLWLGESTGILVNLWHRAGMAAHQQVNLSLTDACQNILVLGGIGSGKTTGVMQPLLLQCLDQGCGGLIFDIKGDVKEVVSQFAALTKRKLVILGPNHLSTNLLEGLSPEVAASFLKSAFLLSNKAQDPFWVDTATELCRNTLGMLSFLQGEYNLQSLYQYLFELDHQETLNQKIDSLLPTLPEKAQKLLKNYCQYQELIFSHFDAKIKSGVYATVAQVLSPFKHPELMEAFCAKEANLTGMEHVLSGSIYLIDLPLSRFGLGAKVAYTFIKLRFFNVMQTRDQYQEYDPQNPVFFMCDEFQEIVSANREGLSDLNFWDKARSSKTIGIISSQSIASFYAALGSHDLAHALLQNFRQKLCLRTEDPLTLEYIERLIGHARTKKMSESKGDKQASKTISEARERVVDAQLFRELKPNQAVAILSVNGHSMDDVLTLSPIYVN